MKNRILKYALIIFSIWTAIILTSLTGNLYSLRKDLNKGARELARTKLQKDLAYRQWATNQGGIYVPISETTPPNPYLTNIPERDITTPSGKELTLINPAYMTRQVNELMSAVGSLGIAPYYHREHLTSLNPLNPKNAADPWEEQALEAFEAGATELASITELDGQKMYRFMIPLVTEERCLKCHSDQGYQVGDIRGGLSISIPYSQLEASFAARSGPIYLSHLAIWLLGGVIDYLFSKRFSHIRKLSESSQKELVALQHSRLLEAERSRVAMLGILEDQKQTEERYRLVAERLSLAAQAADIGVFEYNLKSGQIIWDDALFEIYGLDKESFVPNFDSWADRIHLEDREGAVEEFEQCVREGHQYNTEYRIDLPDGSIRHVHSIAEAHYTSSGEPERVIGVHWDVSDQRLAEHKYKQILDTAIDGFWIIGTDGTFYEVNKAYCRMTGYSLKELKAMNAKDLEPNDHEFDKRIERVQQRGHLRYETRHLTKSGEPIEVQVSCQLDHETRTRVVYFIQDITARKAADIKAQKSMKELQRWYDVTIKREERIEELKGEVNTLLMRTNRKPKYGTRPKPE